MRVPAQRHRLRNRREMEVARNADPEGLQASNVMSGFALLEFQMSVRQEWSWSTSTNHHPVWESRSTTLEVDCEVRLTAV